MPIHFVPRTFSLSARFYYSQVVLLAILSEHNSSRVAREKRAIDSSRNKSHLLFPAEQKIAAGPKE
jgi:hypothetical protein